MQSTPTALFRSRFGITNHSPHSCNRTNPSQRFSSSANYLLQVHLLVNNHSSPMVLLLKLNLRGSGFSRNPFLRALAHPQRLNLHRCTWIPLSDNTAVDDSPHAYSQWHDVPGSTCMKNKRTRIF